MDYFQEHFISFHINKSDLKRLALTVFIRKARNNTCSTIHKGNKNQTPNQNQTPNHKPQL